MTEGNPYGPWTRTRGRAFDAQEPVVVSGIGAVVYVPGDREPHIQVRRTAFRGREVPADLSSVLRHVDPSREIWDTVPVGMYPRLHLGHIIEGGCVLAVTYPRFRFTVDADDGVLQRHSEAAGRGASETGYRVIPPKPAAVVWGGLKGRPGVAYMEFALRDGTERLLIPCTEIVRTYYAPETKLAQAFFSHYMRSPVLTAGTQPPGVPRHLAELYDPAESGAIGDGAHRIVLRRAIPNVAGLNVARLAFDDRARARTLESSELLQQQHMNGFVPRIAARLPFTGVTTLDVTGEWVDLEGGDHPTRYFLVFEIHGCSGRLPFTDLLVDRETPPPRPGEDGVVEPTDVFRPTRPMPIRAANEPIEPDHVPTWMAALRVAEVDPVELSPPDGLRVTVVSERPRGSPRAKRPANESVPIDTVSTRSGTYAETRTAAVSVRRSHRVSGQEPATAPQARIRAGLEIFRLAAERVSARLGASLRWRVPEALESNGIAVMLPFVVQGESGGGGSAEVRSACCFVDSALSERRSVLIAEFERFGSYAYLLEIGRRLKAQTSTLALRSSSGEHQSDDVLTEVVGHAVRRLRDSRGPWNGVWPVQGLDAALIPHATVADVDSTEDLRENLIQKQAIRLELRLRAWLPER